LLGIQKDYDHPAQIAYYKDATVENYSFMSKLEAQKGALIFNLNDLTYLKLKIFVYVT